MKSQFGKFAVAATAVLILASFAMVPYADAARGGGGGGGGGGGRAAAGGGGGGGGGGGDRGGGGAQGGGGARQNAQVNNSKADARTNNVRSTSVNNVNNVNVDRNVNVNVSGNNNGCCNNGWDNDYHPVARAAAVGTAVAVTSAVIGSMVQTVPPGCVPVNVGGAVYQQCGSTWYAPQGAQFVVVNPPY